MQIMFKHKILFFLAIFIVSHSYSFAQHTINQSTTDSSGYYLRYWKQAIDSLNKEWIATKVDFSSMDSKVKRIPQNKDLTSLPNKNLSSLEIEFSARAKEIYALYLHDSRSTNTAISIFEKQKDIFFKVADTMGLPTAFAYLPFALSAMNNKTRNYLGGAGYWQIPYTYGKKEGLLINSYVDERLQVEKATVAAAKTLKLLYTIYGDWKLTLAAYTCGPSNVNKAIRRNGDQVDFYAIQASLPYFGRDVVDALAAANILFGKINNSAHLNYNPALDTIEVSKRLHFQQIADIMNINMDEIRFLNPIYKYDIVPAINKIYYIYLPQGSLQIFNNMEDSIYNYKDSILFSLHKKVILPPPPKGRHWATPAKVEVPENSIAVYYTIKSGDNLGNVALWYNITVDQIEDWNNIYNPRRIQIGKKLKIYVPKSKAAYYKKIDKLTASQKQNLSGKPTSSTKSNNTTKPKKASSELTTGYFWHTVKSGESPYIIAKKYPGVSAEDILRWNNIADATKIQVGQKLKIKKIK